MPATAGFFIDKNSKLCLAGEVNLAIHNNLQ